MSILVRGSRSRTKRHPVGAPRGDGPSVREVCLLALPRPGSSWASGDRLEWGGRVYRVSAMQDRASDGEGATRYVHLAASDAREESDRPGA